MTKKVCTTQITREGDDIVLRFINGAVAAPESPKLDDKGNPKKFGMVRHTGGYQPIEDGTLKISGFLMRKAE